MVAVSLKKKTTTLNIGAVALSQASIHRINRNIPHHPVISIPHPLALYTERGRGRKSERWWWGGGETAKYSKRNPGLPSPWETADIVSSSTSSMLLVACLLVTHSSHCLHTHTPPTHPPHHTFPHPLTMSHSPPLHSLTHSHSLYLHVFI